ncbi:hypothetical protein ACLVWU_11170 [Bdellovibrio sp. HCB290]|uniref:hypothetical protein n=1 Tax=Bdellovibrio sp. HCB290 TaxID=3394356 RepID=UPI0039B3A621
MELLETSDIPPEVLHSVQSFLSFVNIDQTILVIGSGANTLPDKFRKRGFDVVIVEDNPERIEKWRGEGYQVIEGAPAALGTLRLPKVIGGIWAGSAFEHTSEVDLEHSLEVLHLILPNKGALFFSVPKGTGEVRTGDQVTQFYSEAEIRKMLEDRHFTIVLLDAQAPSIITAVVSR